MASIIDKYAIRQYYQSSASDQLMIPKYIKPSKENLSKSVQNESKITRPIVLKKSNSETQDLNSIDLKLKVRLLIFVEDTDGSRSNIFDSEKCQTSQVNSPKKQLNISRSMPKTTQNNLNQTSTKLNNEVIKRMVFGSFPMKVSSNTAIKVHSLKNSNKTMISNVFTFYDNSKLNQDSCFCDVSSNANYDMSQAASPSSLFFGTKTKTIPIKKPPLTSQSIQSCSFNSSTANNLNLASPSSSVPNGAFYGSYAGIYKRLMRSVSNSLISDSTTVQNSSIIESSDELNINQLNISNNNEQLIDSTSSKNSSSHNDAFNSNESEKRSLSAFSNNGSNSIQQSLCEKCVENNCYPKYKIGVAVVFCLPRVSKSIRQRNVSVSSTSPKSPKNSPQSEKISSPLTHSNSINIEQQAKKNTINTNVNTNLNINTKIKCSFDQIEVFPSSETPSPSQPSSPTILNHHHTSLENSINPVTNITNCTSSNENEIFYEFFFSHLPLIEYQFKELIDKISNNLPVYFSNSLKYSRNSHQISIPSQNGSLSNSNRTSNSSLNSTPQTNSFNKRIMNNFDEYERKFNLLFSSPRIKTPVWLSLIKSKSDEKKPSFEKNIFTSLSSTFLNDFVHLNNFYKKTSNSTANSQFILLNKLDFKKSIFKTNEKSYDKEKLFFKKILSTLLKYHLSWVLSVLPSYELSQNSTHNLRKQQADWTRILEKTNPYNPLWAQLGDLHGAVNQPLKLVRCVVLGKNREFVERILFVCSYFIRCGNSSYFDIQQENFDFNQLKKTKSPSIKINLKEITELKYDPMVQLSNVLNSSSITSSLASRSGSSGSMSISTSTSPYANNLSPVNKLDKNLPSSTNAQELPLIGCKSKQNFTKSSRMQDNFGYSLLASYCDEFVFEFVLHGTSDSSFLDNLHQRLVFSKKNSILDCPIDESMYIVIDSDQFEVKVYSSEMSKPLLVDKPIGLVDTFIQSVLGMIDLFQNSEFVLLHLEDKLQEFCTKSVAMNELKSQKHEIDDEKLMQLLDINDESDLEFLKQIQSAIKIPNFF